MSLILFAQANKAVPPDVGGITAELLKMGLPMMIGLGCVFVLSMALSLGMAIWYFMTMYKLYSAISPSNRDMEPGMIFIALIPIPFLGYIWMWLIMLRACSSLQKEFDARGLSDEGGDFGKTKGLVHLLGAFCGPVGLVGFVLYVLQMKKYLLQLEGSGGGASGKKGKSRIADDDDE